MNIFAVDFMTQWVIRNRCVGLTGGAKRTIDIRKNQTMNTVTMLKVVVNTPLLHETRYKCKIRFVVLNAIISYGIGIDQALIDDKCIVIQHCYNRFNRRLILKDFAISREGREMQPRTQSEFIERMTAIDADKACRSDEGGDFALSSTDVSATATGETWDKCTHAFKFDDAGDLFANETIELEIGPNSSANTKIIRGLER